MDDDCTQRHLTLGSNIGWIVGAAVIAAAVVLYAAHGLPAEGLEPETPTPVINDVTASPTPGPILPRVHVVVASGETSPTPISIVDVAPEVQSWPEQLTEEQMRDVLTRAGWPSEIQAQALRVSYCESRWRRSAVGDGGRALGIFQLHDGLGGSWGGGWGWFSASGLGLAGWDDPVHSARVALWAYEHSGWGPWSCRPE